MPMYIDPEQFTKDRAEFAQRGIARGYPAAAAVCADGVVLVALNASASLKKIGEVHDRIAMCAVGKYHEFESLRVAAIRWADARAFHLSRADVHALSLANALAASISDAFTSGVKPLEVELLVAELGHAGAPDRLLRLGFDGSVSDDGTVAVMGAGAGIIADELREASLHNQSVVHAGAAMVARMRSHVGVAGVHVEAGALMRGDSGRRYVPLDLEDERTRREWE